VPKELSRFKKSVSLLMLFLIATQLPLGSNQAYGGVEDGVAHLEVKDKPQRFIREPLSFFRTGLGRKVGVGTSLYAMAVAGFGSITGFGIYYLIKSGKVEIPEEEYSDLYCPGGSKPICCARTAQNNSFTVECRYVTQVQNCTAEETASCEKEDNKQIKPIRDVTNIEKIREVRSKSSNLADIGLGLVIPGSVLLTATSVVYFFFAVPSWMGTSCC